MDVQFLAIERQKTAPAQFRRHKRRPVVGRLGALMGHLQEQQKADLLRIAHVGQAIVTQHMREIPGFIDDVLAKVIHASSKRTGGLTSRLLPTEMPTMRTGERPSRLARGGNQRTLSLT